MRRDNGYLKRSIKNFLWDHKLLHYASSLSFHTILALIPILLISLYIFTKLPIFTKYYENLTNFIFSFLMPVHHDVVFENIEIFLSNTAGLGFIGIVFILYVSIMFFDDFEYVINKIFKRKPRGFLHSISIYLVLTLLIPLGMSLSIFLSIKANIFLKSYKYIGSFDALTISSFLIIWALFFIIYFISPNAKVYAQTAFISSFFASAIWYISKTIFVFYVTINKTYTTIYGSFSTIMLFLIWIYLSWIIFLFGAKLCYNLNESKKKKIRKQNHVDEAFLKYTSDGEKDIDK